MKSSKRVVNWFMRLRSSSKPKLIEGSWSAIDGVSCEEARMLALSAGSKVVIAQRTVNALYNRLSGSRLLVVQVVCDVGVDGAGFCFGSVAP
jgi:hypothetical protein